MPKTVSVPIIGASELAELVRLRVEVLALADDQAAAQRSACEWEAAEARIREVLDAQPE